MGRKKQLKIHKALLKLIYPRRDSCLCCSAERPKRCKTFRRKYYFSCGIVPLLGCGALMSWINACHASTVQNPSLSRLGWTILTPLLLRPRSCFFHTITGRIRPDFPPELQPINNSCPQLLWRKLIGLVYTWAYPMRRKLWPVGSSLYKRQEDVQKY